MLRWQLSPYLARITAHSRLVLGLALCGAVFGWLIAIASPPGYVVRLVVHVPPEIDEGWCIFPPPPSFFVRLASQVDAATVRIGFPNPKLADVASQWIDGQQ